MANTRIYWLHTLSPTHVGTGRGVGYIDLPIHRDKVTNWPVIPGSAFKGVWRDWAHQYQPELVISAFGRASESDNNSNAGALIPTDARLVCLPVRSFRGTFAWCTSVLALQMLHRDMTLAGMADPPPVPTSLAETDVHHSPGTLLKDEESNRVYLEDLDFVPRECATAHRWAETIAQAVFPGEGEKTWRDGFVKRFAVLPDTVYDFLTQTGTEVTARVKIDDDLKTVVGGALWNEEALPAETILAGLVACDRVYHGSLSAADLLDKLTAKPLALQLGGKATVGRGRVRCVFMR